MRRKTFIRQLSIGGSAAILVPSLGLLQSCDREPKVRTDLTDADIPILDALADTILPGDSERPGAAAAGVGAFILVMYTDCLAPEEKRLLLEGVNEAEARSMSTTGTSFPEAAPAQRLQLLKAIQAEAITHNLRQEGALEPEPHYFDLMKGLALQGYFTSEPGMTQAREYLPLPGKYQACIPLADQAKPWAT